MSRLDMFIERMDAQRLCLEWAAKAVEGVPGPVFELGLGNGRTYDHMREVYPDRDIYVFERTIACHPSCLPPDNRLFLGEVLDNLVEAREQFAGKVAVLHADLGGHNHKKNIIFARTFSPLLVPLMAPGGIVISTDKLHYVDEWDYLPLPEGVAEKRAHLYRT